MFYLRRNKDDHDQLDILSDRTGPPTIIAEGRTELEVRRFFHEQAIVHARECVDLLLRDIR